MGLLELLHLARLCYDLQLSFHPYLERADLIPARPISVLLVGYNKASGLNGGHYATWNASEMNSKSPWSALTGVPGLVALFTGLFAIAVFIIDTTTPFDFAVAVLYVVVVLLVAQYFSRREVLIVALGCMALTLLSYALTHELNVDEPLGRCLMSVTAIGATTFVALKNQSANIVLSEQARLLDLSHDTIFVRDMNNVVTYWNSGAEQLYGWSRYDAVGRISHQLLKTVFPEPLQEITAELLRTGRWEGELVHTKRDGNAVMVSSRWSLRRDERGQPVGTLETNNDITERKRSQDALERAQTELAHVNRVMTLGELAASIAHEVNQPLTGVVTSAAACLRLLQNDSPDLRELREALQYIINDGMRASEVVQRIRALSKKADPQRVGLDVNDIIREAIRLLQREFSDHHSFVHLELTPTALKVIGDRIQLQQVIINLVMNGLEAMANVIERPRRIVIRSSQSEPDQVLVEIQDVGSGVETQNLDRLFNAFFSTKPNGMGMGLSICRSIIQAHGGKIWASLNPEGGSIFRFTLRGLGNATV
jgi:two-component system sensor kinase FixL